MWIKDPKSIMPQQRSRLMSNYFRFVTDFFHQYQWVYNFKATEILFDGVLQRIPIEFQTFFRRLNVEDRAFVDLLGLQNNDQWPDCVKKFVADCRQIRKLTEELISGELANSEICPIQNDFTNIKLPKKWNLKKFYEVSYIGNFVGQVSSSVKCDAAVDIGSGLGYLSTHLSSKFKLPVIGVEGNASKAESARRIVAENSEAFPNVPPQSVVDLLITENISQELMPHVANFSRVCLTALHACGDLTPWSLKYFLESDSCKVVAIVSCCYHKMNVLGNPCNFPISGSLKTSLSTYNDISFLKNQWLWRLASQRAGSKFLNDIQKETQNLFYRAVLERFINLGNFQLSKKKRNAYDSGYNNFDKYLEKTIGNLGAFSLLRDDKAIGNPELETIIHQVESLHNELVSWSRVITGVLAMQGAIQLVAEEMILLDRIRFLEESDNVEKAGIIRVIPESVSPRGMVLYGIKK